MFNYPVAQVARPYCNHTSSRDENLSQSQQSLYEDQNVFCGSVPSLASTSNINTESERYFPRLFQHLMQRVVSMLANVGNYFHSGYRLLEIDHKKDAFFSAATVFPIIDEDSHFRAVEILKTLSDHVKDNIIDVKDDTEVKYLIYYIGVAVMRIANSNYMPLVESRAKKAAKEILKSKNLPGLDLLIHLEKNMGGKKDFFKPLINQASIVGRINIVNEGYEDYYCALVNMAFLWGCLLGERSEEIPIEQAYTDSPDIFD